MLSKDIQSDESSSPALAKSPSSGEQALQRLIGGPLPQGKLASLIETVFSSRETIDLAGCLQEGDAQTFIDVVYKARRHP